MNNLFQRTISGVVYLAVIIGSFFLGKYAYGAVFLIAGLLCLMEYYRIAGLDIYSASGMLGIVSAVIVFCVSFFTGAGIISINYLFVLTLLPFIAFIMALYSSGMTETLPRVFFGLLYIIVPLSLLHGIVFPEVNANHFTHRIALGMLTLIWINDTGAYVTGISAGRHKLFPRVSPKKSWEGLAGGTIFTLGAALFMHRIMGILAVQHWIVIGLIVSVFGVFGDLAESLMKRNADMKDSGELIPGHGGVLDRFDSLLFVIPVVYCYLVIV